MNIPRFSRRNLIRAGGLGAAARMLLPELSNPAFAAETVPKMFVMFYSHHGTWKPDWGNGTGGLTLGPLLKPLEPFKNDLVLLSGLEMRTANLYPGNNFATHIQGQVHSLTSMNPLTPVASEGSRPVAGGPSIDQAILEALKAKNGGNLLTPIDSLQLGIADSAPGADQMMGRAGYKRQGTSIKPMGYLNSPNQAWFVAFDGFKAGGAAPVATPGQEDPARLSRRLMAQFGRGQFANVSAQVSSLYGKESQLRFAAHADYMSSLEKSLAPLGDVGSGQVGTPASGLVSAQTCVVPTRDAVPGKPSAASGWVDTLSENMPKLAHLALACGRTRFVTINIEATVSADPAIHEKFHMNDRPGTVSYHLKVAEQVAKTLKLLKESPTADGKNLLYHTTFLWAGELSDGGNHSWNELNWIVGGQSSGALQTGRFVDAKGKTNADLFVSLAKLMGTDMTTFGDPRAFTGAISAIKA